MTDTSTKRAEKLATILLTPPLYQIEKEAALMIRALAAERDALQVENANIKDDLASAERERNHQHGRADKNAQQYAMEQRKRENIQAERDALKAALQKLECDCAVRCDWEHEDVCPYWFARETLKGKDDGQV